MLLKPGDFAHGNESCQPNYGMGRVTSSEMVFDSLRSSQFDENIDCDVIRVRAE